MVTEQYVPLIQPNFIEPLLQMTIRAALQLRLRKRFKISRSDQKTNKQFFLKFHRKQWCNRKIDAKSSTKPHPVITDIKAYFHWSLSMIWTLTPIVIVSIWNPRHTALSCLLLNIEINFYILTWISHSKLNSCHITWMNEFIFIAFKFWVLSKHVQWSLFTILPKIFENVFF